MDYQAYLQSDAWRRKREWVLQFWNYRCCLCFSPNNLRVHHRTYARLGAEQTTDLVVLCDECHARHHKILPEGIKTIQEVLKDAI